VILCGTSLRPPAIVGPGRIVHLANEASFSGLAIDCGCPLSQVPQLATESLRAGARVEVAQIPVPDEPLSKNKRPPHPMAVDDPEERQAARALARRGLEQAHALAIPVAMVELGPVPLHARYDQLVASFQRAEMDEDEPGYRLLRRALEERRTRSEAVLDACRAFLDPLLALADRQGSRLALTLAASPWEAPSPREVMTLLHEFAGSPLSVAAAPARRAALAGVGLAGPPERWPEIEKAASLVLLTDAVGLEHDFVAGVGELDFVLSGEIAQRPLVVTGRADSRFAEIVAARGLAERLRKPAAP
jgi:hypothetical protein